jgi:hypothetical protein
MSGGNSRLAIVLIHSGSDNLPVAQVDIGLGDISVESQTVLHPLVVISVGEVLTVMVNQDENEFGRFPKMITMSIATDRA